MALVRGDHTVEGLERLANSGIVIEVVGAIELG
jgi:hypothetical protein